MQREDVPRGTRYTLDRFAALLVEENGRQNLVAASTVPDLWDRHIRDSAQLGELTPKTGRWLDVGSGPGLPGIVLAIMEPARKMILVEPRARRAEFLQRVVHELGLSNTTVHASTIERVPPLDADVITARALAPLPKLLDICVRHAAPGCTWLLPKGRRAAEEVAAVRAAWQGDFRLVASVTDPLASIVIAHDVQRRARG